MCTSVVKVDASRLLTREAVVGIIRTHLVTTSLAAIVVQAAVVAPMILFVKVPEAFFQTGAFRLAAGALLISLVILVRIAAYLGYRTAAKGGHIKAPTQEDPERVQVLMRYRPYPLAVLHLRFNGKKAKLIEHQAATRTT
jgi:hypothetical protein